MFQHNHAIQYGIGDQKKHSHQRRNGIETAAGYTKTNGRQADHSGQIHGRAGFAGRCFAGNSGSSAARKVRSTAVPPPAAAGPDTFSFTDHKEDVRYSGDAVTFDMVDRTIAVSGQSRLEYGTMVLTARDVMLDTESREFYADGDPLLEDSETIAGRKMGYNFGAKTGAVRGGVTDFDGFYYTGDSIQRYPDGSLKICSGRMTSCDRPDPHFHFWADRMKMRLDDKVVAAPIVMHVGKVPVFALPFYFKSLKQGRRSGILFPSFNFGWSERDGRYIRDFGYYWATNDYTDLTLRIDYNERRELAWSLQNRSVKRYAFNGEIAYSNLRTIDDDSQTKEWRLNWTHSQPNLFDDYNVRARVEMASRELSRDNLNSDYQQDIVDGSLKSSITASRKLSFGNLSFSANRTEYPNAADDDPETDQQPPGLGPEAEQQAHGDAPVQVPALHRDRDEEAAEEEVDQVVAVFPGRGAQNGRMAAVRKSEKSQTGMVGQRAVQHGPMDFRNQAIGITRPAVTQPSTFRTGPGMAVGGKGFRRQAMAIGFAESGKQQPQKGLNPAHGPHGGAGVGRRRAGSGGCQCRAQTGDLCELSIMMPQKQASRVRRETLEKTVLPGSQQGIFHQ